MSLRTQHLLPLLLLSVSLSAGSLELPQPMVYRLPPLNHQVNSAPTAMKVANQLVNEGGVMELTWDDLVPPEWLPANILGDTKIDDLKDDDPRAIEFAVKMKELWAKAPVRKELEGKLIKLPGFVIPLENDGKKVTEFLLVPYMGACIHTPPPPANQTVYVKTGAADAKIRKMFDAVWVTGRVKIEKIEGELATSGYTILATKVEPFQ